MSDVRDGGPPGARLLPSYHGLLAPPMLLRTYPKPALTLSAVRVLAGLQARPLHASEPPFATPLPAAGGQGYQQRHCDAANPLLPNGFHMQWPAGRSAKAKSGLGQTVGEIDGQLAGIICV